MKTSKRLLSFFLAVVMVITTCSVGFAAFAAEPEDEVFTYVDDEGKAVTLTYDGLNELVNTYAPVLIEALRSTLEGAGVNVDAVLASENPIGELLAQLSPMLMGLLGTSSDMQTILGSDYNAFSEEKYSYLNDPDAAIDFWNLYTICKDNKDAGGAIGEFCSSTFKKLEVLLNAYDNTYNSMTTQVDEILTSLLGSKGFGVGVPGSTTNLLVFYYDQTSEFQTVYNAWAALGAAGVPASHENIGAVPLADGTATLKEFTDSVQANGNIYDNGTTETDDDFDFTPFINYVSYYAQRNCIISEGETLSLLDAIYYYYNQALTTDYAQIAGAMIASLPEGTSFTFEQNVDELGIPEENSYSVTFESGKYWYDSAYNQDTGFSYNLFSTYILPLVGLGDAEFNNNNRYILDGIYETLKFNGIDVFPDGPYPRDSTDSGNEWYYSTVEQILVEMGFFADFDEAESVRLACVMDDEEFSQLKEIAAKYNYSTTSQNLANIKMILRTALKLLMK